MTRIEATVTAVLSRVDLTLNRGSDHGVEARMVFDITGQLAAPIGATLSANALHSTSGTQAHVAVISVSEKTSVARIYKRPRSMRGHLLGDTESQRWPEGVQVGDIAVYSGQRRLIPTGSN